MKLKKFLGVVLIMILLGTTAVFGATNVTDETNDDSQESESNEVNEKVFNVIPEFEEELKAKEEKNKEVEISTKREDLYEEKISEDVYSFKEESVTYEDTYIDGDVYMFCSESLSFLDCEIVGNVFVLTGDFSMDNTIVDGSIYLMADNAYFYDCDLVSIYAYSENILIDEDTIVAQDARLAGENITVSGIVERNTYTANTRIEVPEQTESDSVSYALMSYVARVIVVLIVSIFILGGSPKFTAVNSTLKIRSFFKAFFTGLLELIILFVVAAVLLLTGLVPGFVYALVMLTIAVICFGKTIFIVAFSVRLVQNPDKVVRGKSFVYTIILALIFEAVDLLALTGTVGLIIAVIIDAILAITGFGTFVRVVLTARKKRNNKEDQRKEINKPATKEPESKTTAIPEVKDEDESNKTEEPEEPKMIEIPVNHKLENASTDVQKDDKQGETGKTESKATSKVENKDDKKASGKETIKKPATNTKTTTAKNSTSKQDSSDKKTEEKDEKGDFVISDKNKKRRTVTPKKTSK